MLLTATLGLLLGWTGWQWWRRPSTAPPPFSLLSYGTLHCATGQKGVLQRTVSGSHFLVWSAHYKGRDITRFVAEQMEGCQAWEFMVSDALFGGGSGNGTAGLVVEWEEWV